MDSLWRTLSVTGSLPTGLCATDMRLNAMPCAMLRWNRDIWGDAVCVGFTNNLQVYMCWD